MVKNINYLIFSRFLIIIGILLTILIFNFLYPTSLNITPFLNITLLIAVLSGIYFFLNNKTKISKDFIIQLQIFIDIIVISALIYITGSTESPFLFLLTIPIIISSVYLNKNTTILTGLLSFLALIIIIFFYYKLSENIAFEFIISRIVLYGLSFTGIALLSTYLVERTRLYKEEIEKKQIEFNRLNLLLQNIVENIEYAFISLDENLNLIFKNREADKLIEEGILKLLSKYPILKKKNRTFEEDFGKKILRIKYETIHFQEKKYNIFIIEDSTEEKKKEREEKIKERLLYLGEMAAGMAHEIRNPLTSLMASLQLLKEEKMNDNNKNISSLTNIIVDDIKRISSIIEDFLIFTENRNFKIERFEPKKQVETLMEELKRDGYKTDNIKIKIDNKVKDFSGNAYHFNLILKNLLTNSIKAVKNKGEIAVKIYIDEKNMELVVKDTGIGIEEEDLKNIFNPFFTKSKGKGMGMGLTIVKRIVELYRGKIEVFSEKGKGTEYQITLSQKKKE